MTESVSHRRSVALKYDGEGAPKVTAKGRGVIAEEIQSIAKKHGIPIKEDKELVELLSQVELNEEIPEQLYQAVIQVLLFAYKELGKQPPEQNLED